ncbi:hypothetical protein, partial [Faecalibacterium prausnitzii]|uniref:hypothetical protein n=1 Tax=Faecalibacterium prausnitzii TaxID=853 RepID=UPI0011C17BCF
ILPYKNGYLSTVCCDIALFNIAQKPLFPIIEWIAGSVLKSPFFKDTAVSGRYRRVHFYLL